jgi:hypothetical protein
MKPMIYRCCCNLKTRELEWVCDGLFAPAHIHAAIARQSCEKQ